MTTAGERVASLPGGWSAILTEGTSGRWTTELVKHKGSGAMLLAPREILTREWPTETALVDAIETWLGKRSS